MATYDLESLLADVKAIMVDNLNSKIAAINTEKNDSVSLRQISSDAYVLQSLNGETMNFDPFILYGLEDIRTSDQTVNYGYTPKQVDIVACIVVTDQGSDLNIATRMLRYSRALTEIFEENFDRSQNGIKLRVQSLVPVAFQLMNSSRYHRAVGVTLTAEIG